jgi:hypothetical protein
VEVEGPRARAAQLCGIRRQGDNAVGRVDESHVDAELVEALVEEARQHRGGAVQCVARRQRPPAGPHEGVLLAHRLRDLELVRHALEHAIEARGDAFAGDLAQAVAVHCGTPGPRRPLRETRG